MLREVPAAWEKEIVILCRKGRFDGEFRTRCIPVVFP